MLLYYYVYKNFPVKQNSFRLLSLIQGLYYFFTGLWPIIDIHTFISVTGPKTDLWLVKMVGALTMVISLLLFLVAKKRRVTLESIVIILGSCVSYLTIDLYYSLKHVISHVYLADAILQVIFIALWLQWLIKIKFRLRVTRHHI